MNEQVPMEVNLRQAWTYWHLEKLEAHERPQTPRERDALYAAWDAEFDAWLASVRAAAVEAEKNKPRPVITIEEPLCAACGRPASTCPTGGRLLR